MPASTARPLREWGYRGRIVSFEPQAEAHARARAARRRRPALAGGAAHGARREDGEVEIEVSAESDMSSLLPQSALLRTVSPSSRVIGREPVRLARLDA